MLPPIFFKRCIHFCMAMLCLHCLERVFSSCGELVPLWLQSMGSSVQASVAVAPARSSCGSLALERWLSSCGAWAQLFCGGWHSPGSGIEPVSTALAGRFLAASSPGKTEVALLWGTFTFIREISICKGLPSEPRRRIITSQGRNTYQWRSQDLNLQTLICLFTVLCMITGHKGPLPSPQGLSPVWGWTAIYDEVFGHFREWLSFPRHLLSMQKLYM